MRLTVVLAALFASIAVAGEGGKRDYAICYQCMQDYSDCRHVSTHYFYLSTRLFFCDISHYYRFCGHEQRANLLERSVARVTKKASASITPSVIVTARPRLAEKYQVLRVTNVHSGALSLTALREVSLRTSVECLRVEADFG